MLDDARGGGRRSGDQQLLPVWKVAALSVGERSATRCERLHDSVASVCREEWWPGVLFSYCQKLSESKRSGQARIRRRTQEFGLFHDNALSAARLCRQRVEMSSSDHKTQTFARNKGRIRNRSGHVAEGATGWSFDEGKNPGTYDPPGSTERETGFEPATTGLGSRHSTS